MDLTPHLTFRGQCEEAFRFYAEVFATNELGLLTYGDSPMAEKVDPELRDKIVHATLSFPGGALAGADVRPEDYEPPKGFYILIAAADSSEATRIFEALSVGGTVRMPLQRTFWSTAFGVLVDRYGTPWEVHSESPLPRKDDD